MEGMNSFEKGLHRSNSPQMQPEGSYVDALNWIRNDSGRLINEELEEVAQSLTDAQEYNLLGYCPIQDSFIIFFEQKAFNGNSYSEIGLFNNITKSYERIFNDFFHPYKLNFKNEIDSVARVIGSISNPSTSSSGDRVVYFVEKDNKNRRFNIDLFLKDRSPLVSGSYTYSSSSQDYNKIEDFELQLSLSLPYGNMTVADTGGSLPSGVYSVVFRYRTGQDNKTVFGIPTKFYFINDDAGNNEGADGCPPGTQTSKSITITVTNTDLNYPFIEPVIITYEGVANNLVIKSLGVYENESGKQIIFSDESQYKDSVSVDEITQNPVFYESAQSIEQKDNVLVLSNLKGKKYDTSFQEIANKIDVYCYYEFIDTTISPNFGVKNPTDYPNLRYVNDGVQFNSSTYLYYRWNSNNFTPTSPLDEDKRSYKENFPYKDNSLDKGFQRGEVYSFSITPIYKDGTIGFAYHIPAKPSTDYTTSSTNLFYPSVYTSILEYPDYIKNEFPQLGNYVKHHKMPDYGESTYRPLVYPNSNYNDWWQHFANGGNSYNYYGAVNHGINILRVKFKNIDLSSQANNIQGYIIGYQPRNTDANKTIIDNGWARPYSQNGGYKRASAANGSLVVTTTNRQAFAPAIWGNTGVYQYFSPTTHPNFFNRDVNTSYYLQMYGMAYNYISSPNVFYHNWGGDAFFHYFSQSGEISKGNILQAVGSELVNTNSPKKGYKLDWNYASTTSKISKVIKVPNVSNSDLYVDNIYRVRESTGFLHIETEKNIILGTDWDKYFNLSYAGAQYPQWGWNEQGNKWVARATYLFPNYLLFRIINDNKSQYGRLDDAEYVPKKVIFKDVNNNLETELNIEGDIYVTKYWYQYRDFIYENPDAQQFGTPMSTLVGMWYESDINFHMRHRDPDGYPYYPKTLRLTGDNSITVGQEWWKQSIGYNKQYSAESNIKKNFAKPLFFNEVTNFPNRSIYSVRSFENELIDQYRVFPALQYHDVPKDRGVITDTFVFNNNFYHHTEYGLWLSYFNPNTTQASSSGQIVLGNPGVFQLPSKLVLDIKGGYMGTMDKSGTNTPFGRVFLDHKQGKIFLFTSDSPVEISDLGLFSFFREFVNTTDKYAMGYDWANKRLLISKFEEDKNYIFTNNAPVVNIDGTGLYDSFNTAYDIGILDSDKHYKIIESPNNNNARDRFKFVLTEKKAVRFLLVSNKNNFTNGIYTFRIFNAPTLAAEIYFYPVFSNKEKQVEIVLDPGTYWIFAFTDSTTLGKADYDLYLSFSKPLKKLAISYYPKTQTWTSLHDFSPTAYFTTNGYSYAYSNNNFYNMDNLNGVRKNSYITFVENTAPDNFKRFDRIEMNTMSGGNAGVNSPGFVEPTSYIFNNESFTNIHCWTDRQNSTELAFDYPQDYNSAFNSSYDFNFVPVSYYRSSFHAELPLDAVIDPNYNIFGDSTRPNNNLDINADFRAHMKGKFLYTKLSYNQNKPLVLNYVKTYFKPSVA